MHTSLALLILWGVAHLALAAPDEDKLGKAQGYPRGTAATWFFDESVRVGSFSNLAEIPGQLGGKANVLQPSETPLALRRAEREPRFRWDIDHLKNLSIDDYLSRQRIMGLMIVKDGIVQVERYQYDRTAAHRFVSHSMAKSITALAVGLALQEGKISSLDDRADQYAPKLAGTLYGETTIRNLLRMGSGVRFTELYDGKDDLARFGSAASREGVEAAARVLTEREAPQGARFHYASAETVILAAVLRAATGVSLSEYLTPRLWQPIGAETSGLWQADRFGLERASGNFSATLRDYARLGIVLANDGVRPDDPTRKQIVPREFLLEATDWRRAEDPFRPRKATGYYGYGYQFWTFPGEQRRFALLGVYGQMIFVDPQLKLVMVQTAANATASSGKTSLGREANAFWQGVVRHYGTW
jgi:CubicO group peptidase (beta-lactamase class C family)